MFAKSITSWPEGRKGVSEFACWTFGLLGALLVVEINFYLDMVHANEVSPITVVFGKGVGDVSPYSNDIQYLVILLV